MIDHQGTPPLDLQAVEARIDNPDNAGNLDFVGNSIRDIHALLAHARALRTVLAEGQELAQRNLRKASQRTELFRWGERAAAVLAQTIDHVCRW